MLQPILDCPVNVKPAMQEYTALLTLAMYGPVVRILPPGIGDGSGQITAPSPDVDAEMLLGSCDVMVTSVVT